MQGRKRRRAGDYAIGGNLAIDILFEGVLPAQRRRPDAPRRMTAFHVRRDKAALFQWVQGPPGDRSSRKQPEQAWRRRNV